MNVNITPREQQILIDSVRGRIRALFEMAEAYKNGGNQEAQMDCLNEKREAQEVLDKIKSL